MPLTFASLCSDTRYTLLLDGNDTDDTAGRSLRATVMARCPAASVTESNMNDAAYTTSPSYAPRIGPGHMLLLGGGSFYHKVVEALAGVVPVVEEDAADGSSLTLKTRAGATIVTIASDTLSETHDYFVLELAKDASNSVSLIGYGMYDKGTAAAAFYFSTHTLTGAYVVGEWTNVDSDPEPSAGDTFTLLP